MKKSNRWIGPKILFLVGVGGIFLSVLLVGGLWLIFRSVPKPSVEILSPATPQIIESGSGFSIVVRAQSASAVQRIEFYVDGQMKDQQTPEAADTTNFVAVFPWFGNDVGQHQIQVIAYDQRAQASEPAYIEVGVRARRFEPPQPDFVWIPPDDVDGADNDQGQIVPVDATEEGFVEPAQDGEAPADEGGADAQTDSGGQPVEQEDGAAQPQDEVEPQDEAIGDENEFEELIVAPGDEPPTVLLFDVTPIRQGDRIIARISTEVEDDLGVDRIMIFAQHQGDEPNLLAAVECSGERHCLVQREVEVGPGSWWFILNVVDSSGQGIEPQYASLDVVAAEEGPPAVADLDFAELRPDADMPMDDLEDVNLDMGLIDPGLFENAQLNHVVDLNLEALFSEEESQHYVESSRCVRIFIVPQLNGNEIRAEFICDEQSSHNQFLSWKIQRELDHARAPMQGFIKIHEEDFPGKTEVQNGETLTYFDEDILCNANYFYRILFYWKVSPDDSRPMHFTSVDLRNVQSSNCPPGAFNDLNLTAEVRLDGVQLNWRFLGSESWPTGVDYKLWRHLPDDFSKEVISQGEVDGDTLHQQSPEYSYFDPISECGYNQHYYSLTVYQFNQLIASDTVDVPRIPCPEGSLGNIEIEMIPGYALDPYAPIVPSPRHYEALFPHFDLPPGFAWPQGNDLNLRVVAVGEERHQPANHLNQIQISPEIRANGYAYSSVYMVQCSDEYLFHLELWDGDQFIEAGPAFDFMSPACLPDYPMVPHFITLVGTDNPALCGEARYCVVVEWGATPDYPANMSRDVLRPVSRIALKRDLAVTNLQAEDQLWIFPLNHTRFIDTEIPCGSYPGESLLRYSLIGVAEPGIYSAWSDSTGFVDTPACEQPYYETGRIR